MALHGVGFFSRQLLRFVRRLFAKNADLRPGVSEIRLKFSDVEIVVYSTRAARLEEEVAEDLISELFKRYADIEKAAPSKIQVFHIPVFLHTERVDASDLAFAAHDAFELTVYRVRLSVDETIPVFQKADFFKTWGVRCATGDLIYDFEKRQLIAERFYTEQEYWALWDEKYSASRHDKN